MSITQILGEKTILKGALRRWRGTGLYVIIIFLTTPWLPEVVKLAARWSGLSIDQLVNYIKLVTLSGLAIALPLYLYLTGRHKDRGCWCVLLLIGAVTGVLVANFGAPAEATHLLEYGGLGMVIFYTLAKEKDKPLSQGLYYQAAIITLLIGVADELYQGYLPNRYYDLNDIITNAVSGALGLLFLWGVVKPHREANPPPGAAG